MQRNQTENCEIASIPCNLCGDNQVSVLAMRSRSGAPLRTVICRQCGLVWSDPFPHNPRDFYENDYRLEYKKTCVPKAKHIFRAGKVALARYGKIKHLLTERRNVLDVGTGGGEFAYLLKSLGHDLYGIEPNKGYAEYSTAAYQLNLQIGFVQDSRFSLDSFDVITIWHVLEHTEDPYLVLSKLQSLLKPDGVLVVEVPNIEAICQAPNSTFHEAHLFNFNIDTLAKLGERAGLIAESHLFSDDTGNLTVFFRKNTLDAPKTEDWAIIDNAARITRLVQKHSNLNHYLTVVPYRRFLNRMRRSVVEKIKVMAYGSNKRLLDHLYQNDARSGKV